MTAAMVSALLTYFNIVPFALRALKQAHSCEPSAGIPAGWCFKTCRLVPARQRRHDLPDEVHPGGCEAVDAVRSSAHTRVLGFDFVLPVCGPTRTVRDVTRIRHIRQNADIGSITR
jgi:hypothetical protein